MLHLDGTGGGGHLVRTAVALSAVTGTPFRMTGVRGAREKPGLGHQHLAAIRTVADACGADLTGVELGSRAFAFDPGVPRGGEVRVEIGTAGSLVLVFDALLPLAAGLDAPLDATVARAGTDVPSAPTFDYHRRAKLPLLREFGLDAGTRLERRGFYPAGGGAATLSLGPSDPAPLALDDRGSVKRMAVYSRATGGLREASVAERQAERAAEALSDLGVAVEASAGYVSADSPGSVITVVAAYERVRAGFGAIGRRGKPSEAVADEAVSAFRRYHGAAGAADPHLADQVLPLLALAGGSVTTPARTPHVDACLDLLDAFGRPVRVEEFGEAVRLTRDP